MEYDLAFVIRAINEVNDNIWLGDYKKAIEIADLNLDAAKKLEFVEFEKTANEMRRTIQQVRKEAKQKKIKNRRFWVAERVSKTIEEKQLDPVKNLFGALLIHLSDLREAIVYLMETKSQTTMESYPDKISEEDDSLQKTDRYRYAVQRLPDRWEVRAILGRSASQWDLGKLGEELSNYGFSIEEVFKERPSRTFELYSQNMYAQVLGQENEAEISIYTSGTLDARQRVRKIVETVLRILGQ